VYGVFTTEPAILVHLEPVRGVLFVFCRVVISLFTFVASEGDFYSHRGASFVFRDLSPDCLPVKIDRYRVFYFLLEKLTRLSTGKKDYSTVNILRSIVFFDTIHKNLLAGGYL